MALKEMVWEGMAWIRLVEDRDKWETIVNKVINIQVPQHAGNFRPAEKLLASQEGLCCYGVSYEFTVVAIIVGM
jgi:hypothetical protein